MNKKDAVLIASRALAMYFFWWALDAASYLPERIVSLSHHAADYSVLTGPGYFRELYLFSVIANGVRSIVLLVLAIWFYKSGPTISNFLLPVQDSETGT